LTNVLSFNRQPIFQEDGTICDPKTGEIRPLNQPAPKPKIVLTRPQTAAKFIADLFGDGKTEHDVHICRYPNSGGDLSFKKINTREGVAIERFVQKYDEPGGATYFGCGTLKPGATGRTKSDVSEISFLWADVDFKDIHEDRPSVERRLANLKYPPSYTVFTGHGIHCYWLLTESVAAQAMQDRIEGDLTLLCDLVGGDTNVCEIARVMRLPGSHNSKFDDEMIPVEILTSNGKRYHLDDIEEMLAETAPIILRKERPGARTVGEMAGTDPYTEYGLLAHKAPIDVKSRLDSMLYMGGDKDGIHPTQRSVTASLIKCGQPIDDVVALVLAATKAAVGDHYGKRWNWGREEQKIRGMSETALKKYPPQASAGGQVVHLDDTRGSPNGPLIVSSAGFLAGFVPPDYLIDGILQRRFCYSMTAPTGTGKTAVALMLAAHTALGRPLGEARVENGRVLYLAGENPDDIRMRWLASADKLGFDPETIEVNFLPGVFRISEIYARIHAEVMKIGPVALVVVDTSAAYYEGDDENNNVQMGVHARRLRSLVQLPGEPCVLVACHPVKNATFDNMVPKGGGSFLNEVDGNLTCTKTDSVVTLHWQGKYRGPDFAPLPFQLHTVTTEGLSDSKGRLIPSVVATPVSEQERGQAEASSRQDEDAVLLKMQGHRRSLVDIALLLNWMTKEGKPYKTRVHRAAERLKKSKLVQLERGTYVLTPKGLKEAERIKQL
jgi:hypothetical protein